MDNNKINKDSASEESQKVGFLASKFCRTSITSSRRQRRRSNRAQILLLFGLMLPILCMALGLCLDVGLLYLADARMTRALDSSALRIGRSPSDPAARRANVAIHTMRTNFPGFLHKSWGTPTISITGDISRSGGEKIQISSRNPRTGKDDTITITTEGSGQQGGGPVFVEAVTTEIRAATSVSTYFMRVANADAYSEVNIAKVAKAERQPAVIAVIVDLSGSMLSNGFSGKSRGEELFEALDKFVKVFDENRDFLLLVGYSSSARVIWPPDDDLDGKYDGVYFPSGNFTSGSGASLPALTQYVDSTVKFGGTTNAYEGLRLAAHNIQEFLRAFPSGVRKNLSVNYVLMTDGQFNAVDSYMVGPGYGRNLSGGSSSGSSTGQAYTNPSKRPSWLAGEDYDFHMQPLLVGELGAYNITAQIPLYYSTASGGSHNLSNAVYNASLQRSIRDSDGRTRSIPRGVRGATDVFSSYSFQYNWATLTIPHGQWHSIYAPANWITSWHGSWEPWGYGYNKIYNRQTQQYEHPSAFQQLIERAKLYNSRTLLFSGKIDSDENNPFRSSQSPRYGDDPRERMKSGLHEFANYGWGYRHYANQWGIYGVGPGTWASHRLNAMRRLNNPSMITDGMFYGSIAMTDFYPDYTYGGDINEFPTESKKYEGVDDLNLLSQHVRSRTQWNAMWSLRSSNWVANMNIEDAYFNVEAQAYVLRMSGPPSGGEAAENEVFQNAVLYTVDYSGSGGARSLRRVANDDYGTAFPTYQEHKVGKYYNASSLGPNGLRDAFADIASRVALKLTK